MTQHEQHAPGSSLAYQVVIPLLLVLAAAGAFFGVGVRRDTPQNLAVEGAPALVETAQVATHADTFQLTADGLVVPFREITLAAEVAGRVKSKSPVARAGRFVASGTPLLEIDPRDYEFEVERLRRERNQADASLQELDVEHRNAENLLRLAQEDLVLQQRERQRVEALRARGIITESEVDTSRRAEIAAQNSVQNVQNQMLLVKSKRNRLEQAQALADTMLQKAELDLARTKIVAPAPGVILNDMVEQDSWVQRGDKLIVIEDTSAAEVRCYLRMEEVDWLWRSVPATPSSGSFASPAAGGRYQAPRVPVVVSYRFGGRVYQWDGHLDRFEGLGLEERTRMVPCRIVVSDPQQVRVAEGAGGVPGAAGPQALIRGMYVQVHFQIRPSEPLLVLPEQAIRPQGAGESGGGSGTVVWCVREAKLAIEPVHVIRALDGGRVLVHADRQLQAGDRVVVSPLAQVRQGQPVREEGAETPVAAPNVEETDETPARKNAPQTGEAITTNRE